MITAHLTSLAENGYVTKEQSEDDKRVYYVLPTEKALRLVKLAQKASEVLKKENENGSER